MEEYYMQETDQEHKSRIWMHATIFGYKSSNLMGVSAGLEMLN